MIIMLCVCVALPTVVGLLLFFHIQIFTLLAQEIKLAKDEAHYVCTVHLLVMSH